MHRGGLGQLESLDRPSLAMEQSFLLVGRKA